MRNTRWMFALLLLVASLALAACGDDDDDDGGGGSAETSTAEQASAIESNPDNASTTITVGSKNFTEQKLLGEIYAQGLEAAGYKVKKELNLGDEKTALKAVEGGQIDGYPEYTGTALGSFFGVKSSEIPKDANEAFTQAKDGFAKKGITAFPPTPFTSSNEVGLTKEKADELGVHEDLRPLRQGRRPHAVRLPRVPPARGLPQGAPGRVRAPVQGVQARRHRPAPRGARQGPGRRVDRVHDRPADRAQRLRPARGRQGHVPALQLDVRREERDGREGGARPRDHDRGRPGGPDRRGDAGAERPRRPRQEDAGGSGRRVPEGVGPDRSDARVRLGLPAPAARGGMRAAGSGGVRRRGGGRLRAGRAGAGDQPGARDLLPAGGRADGAAGAGLQAHVLRVEGRGVVLRRRGRRQALRSGGLDVRGAGGEVRGAGRAGGVLPPAGRPLRARRDVVEPNGGDFYGGWITPDVQGPFKGAPGTASW